MRIAPKKLVQRVEDDLVIVDESTGNEVVLTPEELNALLLAAATLYPDRWFRAVPRPRYEVHKVDPAVGIPPEAFLP